MAPVQSCSKALHVEDVQPMGQGKTRLHTEGQTAPAASPENGELQGSFLSYRIHIEHLVASNHLKAEQEKRQLLAFVPELQRPMAEGDQEKWEQSKLVWAPSTCGTWCAFSTITKLLEGAHSAIEAAVKRLVAGWGTIRKHICTLQYSATMA